MEGFLDWITAGGVIFALALTAYAPFKDWLNVKKEQCKLGGSTQAVGDDLGALRDELTQERARLTRRIEDLEAIVTSQTWDVLCDNSLNDGVARDSEAALPLNQVMRG